MDLEVLLGLYGDPLVWFHCSFCYHCLSPWHVSGSVPGELRALSHYMLTLIL